MHLYRFNDHVFVAPAVQIIPFSKLDGSLDMAWLVVVFFFLFKVETCFQNILVLANWVPSLDLENWFLTLGKQSSTVRIKVHLRTNFFSLPPLELVDIYFPRLHKYNFIIREAETVYWNFTFLRERICRRTLSGSHLYSCQYTGLWMSEYIWCVMYGRRLFPAVLGSITMDTFTCL